MTPQQKEAMHSTSKMVTNFIQKNDSGPFREPVDWKGLELYDYPEIVTHMMDLGTFRKKLECKEYQCAARVVYDLRLIWKNCMLYNAEVVIFGC